MLDRLMAKIQTKGMLQKEKVLCMYMTFLGQVNKVSDVKLTLLNFIWILSKALQVKITFNDRLIIKNTTLAASIKVSKHCVLLIPTYGFMLINKSDISLFLGHPFR